MRGGGCERECERGGGGFEGRVPWCQMHQGTSYIIASLSNIHTAKYTGKTETFTQSALEQCGISAI